MEKQTLFSIIDGMYDDLNDMSQKIWEYAEIAGTEFKSSALQKEYLKNCGFTIREVPNMPTAFMADYGSGKPIIGVLGEYDALPGLSQKAGSTVKEPVEEGGNGHGCGHNLIGTGAVGTCVAIKKMMEEENLQGTIRYYGCPAEEQLIGKPLMAREGVFNDLDICLSWHPEILNQVIQYSSLAVNSLKFRFKGVSAHAAMAPHLGRSALDAVELMNVGCNYLREHIVSSARMHYVITKGGRVPNAVPDDAEVWYMIRDKKRKQVEEITERVFDVAKGAALMTGTTVTHELVSGCYDMLINRDLSELMRQNAVIVGGPKFDAEDIALAQKFADLTPIDVRREEMETFFAPGSLVDEGPLHMDFIESDDWDKVMPGTFDHGDVSYLVPFAYLFVAGMPTGMAGHTWEKTACAGAPMGMKSVMCGAKIMAGTIYDVLRDPSVVDRAKESFEKDTAGRKYVSAFDQQ